MKKILGKFSKYSFWVALVGVLAVFLQNLSKIFGCEIQTNNIESAIMSFCGVLVVLGVVTKDSDDKTTARNNVADVVDNESCENSQMLAAPLCEDNLSTIEVLEQSQPSIDDAISTDDGGEQGCDQNTLQDVGSLPEENAGAVDATNNSRTIVLEVPCKFCPYRDVETATKIACDTVEYGAQTDVECHAQTDDCVCACEDQTISHTNVDPTYGRVE